MASPSQTVRLVRLLADVRDAALVGC